MNAYEKLGAFYLGRNYDLDTDKLTDDFYLYDSRDLVTHAVCVGMTGSGKTGLCVSLIEEAAIDGVPAIIIDPKGDLANLMLTFPDLSPSSFRPWVNEDAARQKGMTVDAYAEAQAKLWKTGLAEWGQDGSRIQRMRDSAEFAVYTPGSTAATPVSILSTLAAPAVVTDDELLADRAATTASSLLSLVGEKDDSPTSREHVVLSTILMTTWRNGESLDLAGLIRTVQTPPFSRVGVLELESFYPSKDRFELAMKFNALMASPRFATWLEGEPLDIDRFLYTETGKPRISIFSISHLDDDERMFFASLLFNETLAWMRTKPGTSSLRAILYMDEIFGFLPPVANPPSKRPLLTMLKQARAHGLGLVLATQNPADIDYKALSNAGTWFIGRLQTERDKRRLLDGLEGAAGDSAELEKVIADLDKRVFLARNVHEEGKAVFHTRWAMSYLAGPMTRMQLKALSGAQPNTPAATPRARAASTHAGAPVLGPGIPQSFLQDDSGASAYRPALIGIAEVRMRHRGGSEELVEKVTSLVPLDGGTTTPSWDDAVASEIHESRLRTEPPPAASFDPLPAGATVGKNYPKWKKAFADSLYRNMRSTIYRSKHFRMTSEPGESERDFRIRISEVAREKRDEQVEKLRKRYDTRFARIDERIRTAEQRVERESDDVKSAGMQTAVSLGTTLLSAFLGRKATSRSTLGRATTTMRGAGRTARQKQDVTRARGSLRTLIDKRQDLAARFEEDVDALEDKFDAQLEELNEIEIRPRKIDIHVDRVSLLWVPRGTL